MSRSTRLWVLAYKVIGAAIVVLVFAALALVSFNNAQLRAEHREIFAAYQASVENAESLYEQLLELGEDPEGEKPSNVSPAPPTSVQGETGDRGATGAPGRAPTDAEIAAAVAAYCADNACVGATGAVGAQGLPGAIGPQGVQGPAGEQGPMGATGQTGPAGPACPDGYSVSYVWLSVAESQFGVFSRQPAAICRPT
jgi:hypothetical protein